MSHKLQIHKQMEQVYTLLHKVNDLTNEIFIREVLFSWRWWFGVFLSIAPWIIWLVIKKKKSESRILIAGLFVILITSGFDVLGTFFDLWRYYYTVVPFKPAFIPWDFTLFPVSVMLLLQVKPNISPLIKAIVFAATNSFIAEPIFTRLNMYEAVHWNHYYSFPIYFIIYLLANVIATKKYLDENNK